MQHFKLAVPTSIQCSIVTECIVLLLSCSRITTGQTMDGKQTNVGKHYIDYGP